RFCKSVGQTVAKIDPLNAALLQQSGSRPALGRASDLETINQHVSAHRMRETTVGKDAALQRPLGATRRPYQFCVHADSVQGSAQSAMNLFVDQDRRFAEGCVVHGNYNGIGQVISVKNYPAAGPAAN